MNNKISSQAQFSAVILQLTPAALLFLNGITKGIPHLTIYIDLLFSMATTEGSMSKRGIDVHLMPKEVEASANGLGEKWNLGRKVMTRLLKEMEELGLLEPVKTTPSKLTSLASMTAVKDWLPVVHSDTNESTEDTSADHQNDELPLYANSNTNSIHQDNRSESISQNKFDEKPSLPTTSAETKYAVTPPEAKPNQAVLPNNNKPTNHTNDSLFDDDYQ